MEEGQSGGAAGAIAGIFDLTAGEGKRNLAIAMAALLIVIGAFFYLSIGTSGPGNAELTVLVKDADGKPVYKATVSIAGKEGFFATTNKDGRVTFSPLSQGQEIRVEASKNGFKKGAKSLKIGSNSEEISIDLDPELENTSMSRAITFVGPNGVRLEGKPLSIELSCSSGVSVDSPSRQVTQGRIEVEQPSGCGTLLAKVSGSGFEDASYNLAQSQIVKLAELAAKLGKATITVRDETGRFVDRAQVTIIDSRAIPTGNTDSTRLGEVSFNLEPGAYTAKVVDNTGMYAQAEAQFTLDGGGGAKVNVVLTGKPVAVVSVKVVDRQGGQILNGARLSIEGPQGSRESRDISGTEITVAFPAQGIYTLIASADSDYALGEPVTVDTSKDDGKKITIGLSKCASASCRALRVKVVDEDLLPVINARVGLVGAADNFFADIYGMRATDFEGIATFPNVKSGAYRAIAQKFPSEGESGDFEVTQGAGSDVTVKLIIGKGTIEVGALDNENRPIPFGYANFKNEGTEQLGKVALNAQGKASVELKADKRVFVTLEADGYAPYNSPSVQVLPGKTTKISAKMQKQISGTMPRIEFEGIFDSAGQLQKNLAAGTSDTARFKIIVPKELDGKIGKLGFFVRVGSKDSSEKDSIYISAVNAPRSSVLKGATFSAPKSSADDMANVTNDEAKWALVSWEGGQMAQGVYGAEIEVTIRDSATAGAFLPLYYRAFAEKLAGGVLRDPADTQLNESEDAAGKQGLYAQSYVKEFYEGAQEECDSQFCYSDRITDKREGLFLTKPYALRIFGDYTMQFSLTNNSPGIHDNANILFKNSVNGVIADNKVALKSYNIKNADSQSFTSQESRFESDAIALGDFRQNKSVAGTIQLQPEILGETAIDMRVISNQQQVFGRLTALSVVNEKDLNISILPKTLPALTEFDLNVEVRLTGPLGGFDEVDGAIVRIERITSDRRKTVLSATTGMHGKVSVKIPASEPGTRIAVRVEKDGYASATTTLKVSSNLLSVTPQAIRSSLNLTSKHEDKVFVEVKNLVPIDLEIKSLRLGGNFYGLIDTKKVNNWLAQYTGKSALRYGESRQLTLLSAISEDAKLLDEPKKLQGSLYIEVSNANGTLNWPIEVPVEVAISLSEPPKEPNCLEVSLKEWKDATLGGNAQTEFHIRNNCLSEGGKPLDLANLKAKIKWNSNRLGNVELHVTDSATGSEASGALSEGAFSNLLEFIPAGKEYVALLEFTPKGDTRGQKAQFNVIIDAAQITNEGEQLVGATNEIASEIDIIDLSECIKYEPDAQSGLILQPEDDEGRIEIDSAACGNVDIDFWLCRNNKDCAGGVEGAIQASPDKFTLTPKSSKKIIVVGRQAIPGLYGLNVDVRTPGSNYRQIALIDVLAKPTAQDAFDLYKYDFTVKGKGAKDSTQLTNRFLLDKVDVDASICDWGEATEKGWWNWKMAGVGAVVGAVASIKPAMDAAKMAAQNTATKTSTKLAASKSSQAVSSASTKASSNTLEGVCRNIDAGKASAISARTACSLTPAKAQVEAAAGQLEAAAQQCNSIRQKAQQYDNIDDSAFGQLDSGITPYGDAEALSRAQGFVEQKQALNSQILGELQAVSGQLQAASAQYAAAAPVAETSCKTTPATCNGCPATLSGAVAKTQQSATSLQSYIAKDYGEAAAKTGIVGTNIAATRAASAASQSALSPALSAAATSAPFFSPTAIMGIFTVGGFFVGGVIGNLFGQDPCDQRHSNELPDYMINLVEDAGPIESEDSNFSFDYDMESAQVIGKYEKQRVGIIVTNNGIEDPKPVFSTVTFNAKEHLHSDPTRISRGNSSFGPFNVPDHANPDVAAKIHLKFRTQDVPEKLPDLSFDTISCVSGNRMGITGKGALPKIKLNWSFGENGIGNDSCLQQNPEGVYCDAVQFSIMLSRRLNALREFFDLNPDLSCPANPLAQDAAAIGRDLNINAQAGTSCYINSWAGYLEGEPAIKGLLLANEGTISWTGEIPNTQAFLDTIHFNALLMEDGYTPDFGRDFARHYSQERFFDTPDWFFGLAKDSSGKDYGVGKLFADNAITFKNRYFDSQKLPAAGTYEVLIGIEPSNGSFRLFRPDGTPNAAVDVEFYMVNGPAPSSAFYSTPIDGLVGLEGDSFNRQGYGVSFENRSAAPVNFNNEAQPAKSNPDSGSNAIANVATAMDKGFYTLNASPSQRGSIFELEKVSASEAKMRFSPSKATPVMLKVNADTISTDNLAAFYTITANETPIDVGMASTYWDGAGACLDPSGAVITESFDFRSDRAATSKDPVIDWQSVYGIDFGAVNYTGRAYLRTILYTDPQQEVVLRLESPRDNAQFLTPDEGGQKVRLAGVGGISFNNPGGGSLGSVNSLSDVFGLVVDRKVCVVDSGRKAGFFWNPKAVYEMAGKERNISELTNSLVAGESCIGFG